MSAIFSINGNTPFEEFRKLHCCLNSREGSIACYHAGKQFNATGYTDGLQVGSSTLVRCLAREVFNVADLGIQKVIDEIIDEFEVKCNGQLHYCLDRRAYERTYHYLYFGSESLILLADRLKAVMPKHNFRRMLISCGHPVIVNFRLKIAELGDFEVEEIQKILDRAIKERYRDPFLGKSFVHYSDVGASELLSIKRVKGIVKIYRSTEHSEDLDIRSWLCQNL